MTTNYAERIAEIDAYAIELRKLIPETVAAFGGLSKAAQIAGSLDKKTKELLALAIAVAIRCEGCIAYHTHDAIKAGATRAELLETIGIGVMMAGGPGTIYAAHALDAVDQFLAEPPAISASGG